MIHVKIGSWDTDKRLQIMDIDTIMDTIMDIDYSYGTIDSKTELQKSFLFMYVRNQTILRLCKLLIALFVILIAEYFSLT